MPETPEILKEKGNAAFVKKDFKLALRFYNQVLDLQPSNHLVWANRSATKSEVKDYDGAVLDAQRAIELCPSWPKGFVRKAIALSGRGDTFLAIEAYNKALKIEHNETISSRVKALETKFYEPRFRSRRPRSLEVERRIDTCHPDVALAFAAGRDIQFPSPPPMSAVRTAIIDHATRNPEWDSPKQRFLFIPCVGDNRMIPGQVAGMEPRNLVFDPLRENVKARVDKLLGCRFTDSELLYSEDRAEMLRGNENGVGLGYIYKTYEFIMDDNCVNTRPLNETASRLLYRPKTYGPVLVLRATHIKSTHDLYQSLDAVNDTVAWDVLSLEELESEEWRIKRAEWKQLLQRSQNTEVKKVAGRSTATSELDMILQQLGVQVVPV